MARAARIGRTIVPLVAAGLLGLLVLLVLLSPAETQLGDVVKLVYVHGALIWTGLIAFSIAGVLGLLALVVRYVLGSNQRAETWSRGTEAAGQAAPPIRVVRQNSQPEAPNYGGLEKPTVQRQRAVGDGLEEGGFQEELLDIPAFLRRQAD